MAITFDPATKRIVLDSSYADVGDIYSRWKEWVRTADNAKYLPAFRAIGGDPLGGALYVSLYTFLQNGWRIRPMESNHTLVIEGNISVEEGGDPVVPTLGNFRVLVQYTVPERAQAIAVGGDGGATPAAIAAAVRSELAAELAKIQELTFSTPNVVDASGVGGGTTGVLYWNGTNWVPAGT